MQSQQEAFWDAGGFAVITDKTKPAMKWTIDELNRSGKDVFVVDMSEIPDEGTLRNVTDIPGSVDSVVIGITSTNPSIVVEELVNKGINKIWIHWRTETPEVKKLNQESSIQCITGRCPMMYLSSGANIHTLHRTITKLLGKY